MKKRSPVSKALASLILIALISLLTPQIALAAQNPNLDPPPGGEEQDIAITPTPMASLRLEVRQETIREEVDVDASVRHPEFEPIPVAPDVTDSNGASDAEIPALFAMINAARAEAGLPALVWSDPLAQAALMHATDMAQRGFVSHLGSDGSTCAQRVYRTGYFPPYPSEIIVWAIGGAAAAFNWWWNSPVHHGMILSGSYSQMGIARVPHPFNPGHNYFVVVFARS